MTNEHIEESLSNDGLVDRMLSGYERFIRIKQIYYSFNQGHTWRRWLNYE